MVNFDNETTVATPAKDVMKIYLLQCKAYTEDTWRQFRKQDFSGIDRGISDVRAALEQLFIVIEPIIERHWNEEDIKKGDILGIIENGDKKAILNMIRKFNKILDKTRLTRVDTKFASKSTWESSNLQHGY